MTAQTPESILLDGEEWLLLGTPLDPYLAANGLIDRFVSPHTANWRGYQGRWRVDAGGLLFLDAVAGTVRALGSGTQTVSGSAALRGASLPMVASFFTGRLRLARGGKVRHVHSGFNSVWEEEILLEVDQGRVLSRQLLPPPSAMGSAGPYRLHEQLLGELSGGGFGHVLAATGLDEKPLVAKVPLPRGGGNRTEIWMDTPVGRRPLHLPAKVYRGGPDQSQPIEVGPELTAAVLRREADILQRDGGRLLPRSFGVWRHYPSGHDVLVMERLVGQPPATPADVVRVLGALAEAVERGTFDAHGDVKREHVFIADGNVRICDPAPRFDDPQLRGLTPAYNPRGFSGPAADVAACASLLRYLPDAARTGHAGWRWCAAVLDAPVPPPWIHSHRAALRELRIILDVPQTPPPPGWTVPPVPGGGLMVADGQGGGLVAGGPFVTMPVPTSSAPSATPVEGHSFAALALVVRASVIEPVDDEIGDPTGVFLPTSEHAETALDAILTALSSTVGQYARIFGVHLREAPQMTLVVQRASRGAVPGLTAQTISMPQAGGVAPGPRADVRSLLALAWNAVAATRLDDAFQHLADAVERLVPAPDPRLAADLIDIAQRIGGTLTVLHGHAERALEESD